MPLNTTTSYYSIPILIFATLRHCLHTLIILFTFSKQPYDAS